MNEERGKMASADDDVLVRDGYRAVATESTPPDLDRLVIRDAREAARPAGPGKLLGPWQRPLAFAATLGLSIAVLLELSDISLLDLPGTAGDETANGVAVDPDTADDDTFATEADAAAQQIRQLEATAETALQQSPDEERFQADMGAVDATVCEAGVTADPELWWSCIDALYKAHRTNAAEAELERLLKAFPEFTPPR